MVVAVLGELFGWEDVVEDGPELTHENYVWIDWCRPEHIWEINLPLLQIGMCPNSLDCRANRSPVRLCEGCHTTLSICDGEALLFLMLLLLS